MQTIRHNPPGIWRPDGRAFNQAVVPGAGQTVLITGQVSWDADGNVVGQGDAAEQFAQCFRNTGKILSAMGGTLEDLVAITIYFTDRNDIPALQATRNAWLRPETAPTSNFIQVPGLIISEFKVELVPTAVVPAGRFKVPA